MRRTLFEPEHVELPGIRTAIRGRGDHSSPRRLGARGIVPRELFPKRRRRDTGHAGPGGVRRLRRGRLPLQPDRQRRVGFRALPGSGLGITLHNDICLPYFLRLCNEEQKARWLPGIADGSLITALAMNRARDGLGLAGLRTTAVREGDEYVVNGSKTFITNGINSDLVIAAVKTDPSQRHAGVSLLIVERGMEGFERGRNLEKVVCMPRTRRAVL